MTTEEFQQAKNTLAKGKVEPQYIVYLRHPVLHRRYTMKSKHGEAFKSFKERIVKCYPDWKYQISEFHPIYD